MFFALKCSSLVQNCSENQPYCHTGKMNIVYVRISSIDQNETRQGEVLEKYGIEHWYIEKISGKDVNRPKLQEMLEYVREGATVHIHDLSRLARSTADLLVIVHQLSKKGVHLVSNKNHYNQIQLRFKYNSSDYTHVCQ